LARLATRLARTSANSRDEAQWDAILEAVKLFKQTHGRFPRSSGGDADETRLYDWLQKQHGHHLHILHPRARQQARPGLRRPLAVRVLPEIHLRLVVIVLQDVTTHSNPLRFLLTAEKMRVFAGDCVPKKKPSPDIYNLAAETLGVSPARCVVIEDSKIGLAAGKAAGMRVVVTESYYTGGEDFAEADVVFKEIGDNFGLVDDAGELLVEPAGEDDAGGGL
jgi:HAD superfamily hydrolase (TIGR01509 family)